MAANSSSHTMVPEFHCGKKKLDSILVLWNVFSVEVGSGMPGASRNEA